MSLVMPCNVNNSRALGSARGGRILRLIVLAAGAGYLASGCGEGEILGGTPGEGEERGAQATATASSDGTGTLLDEGFDERMAGWPAGWREGRPAAFPATSIVRGHGEIGQGLSEPGAAPPHWGAAISNLAYGSLRAVKVPIPLGVGVCRVFAKVRGSLGAQTASERRAIRMRVHRERRGLPSGSGGYPPVYLSDLGPTDLPQDADGSPVWRTIGGSVSIPKAIGALTVEIWVYHIDGWVAFDDLSVTCGTKTNLIPNGGFEAPLGNRGPIYLKAFHEFPATSTWRGSWGIGRGVTQLADTDGRHHALVISNLAYGQLISKRIGGIQPGHTYTGSLHLRGELTDQSVAKNAGIILRAYFYDSDGAYIRPYRNFLVRGPKHLTRAANGKPTWQEASGSVTAPAGAQSMVVRVIGYMLDGWVAFDEVKVDGTLLRGGGFQSAPGADWQLTPSGAFPATSIWRSTWGSAAGLPTAGEAKHYAIALSNHAYAYLRHDRLPVRPQATYTLSVDARGELSRASGVSDRGVQLVARFFDAAGQRIAPNQVAFHAGVNDHTGTAGIGRAWRHLEGKVKAPASATEMDILLYNYLADGWVAFDNVKVVSSSAYQGPGERVGSFGYGRVEQLYMEHSAPGRTGQWWCDNHFGGNLGGWWRCRSVSGGHACSATVPNGEIVSCSRYADVRSVRNAVGVVDGQTGQWWCDNHFGGNMGGTWACLHVSSGTCSQSARPDARITCGRYTAVDETPFARPPCSSMTPTEEEFCAHTDYMDTRLASTLYLYNDYVRAGLNRSYGGVLFELYGVDKRNRIEEHGGSAVQLSMWGYDANAQGAARFRTQVCDPTPYPDAASCAAANDGLPCSLYPASGAHISNCTTELACGSWTAGGPWNPIQAQAANCGWHGPTNDIDQIRTTGRALTLIQSAPYHFTKSTAMTGMTWRVDAEVPTGRPYLKMTYQIDYTGPSMGTHNQEIPAIFTDATLGAYYYYYGGGYPYSDPSGAVTRTSTSTDSAELKLPARAGPLPQPPPATYHDAQEEWMSVCDAAEDQCLTVATFSPEIRTFTMQGQYITALSRFALETGDTRSWTIYLFPYRYDQVVADKSVRQWIYEARSQP